MNHLAGHEGTGIHRWAPMLITGAGSGIGRSIAKHVAAEGLPVVCCGRRLAVLEETVSQIKEAGGDALAVEMDVTDYASVCDGVAKAEAHFGALHAVFHNAGRFASLAGVHEADPDNWWEDVRANLQGGFHLFRATLPGMLKAGRGLVIAMNGGRPTGGSGYACGKAGLLQLVDLIKREMDFIQAPILAYTAGPGLVATDMTALQADSEAGRFWIPSTAQQFAAQKTRSPDDIARATVELLKVAGPQNNGKSYTPDTDFSTF